MIKDPEAYALQVLTCFNGDSAEAQREMFNQARAFPDVPCSFWRDAYNKIPYLSVKYFGADDGISWPRNK